MPKVAVIMACYNARPYLPDAIESVLNQTYTDFELVIVDDGSSDGSKDYVEQLAAKDRRIRIDCQANQGQAAAANRAIAISESEYLVRMDADDVTMPDRLEKQVAFMDAHREVGLSGGQMRRLGSRKRGLVSNLPLDHDSIVSGLLKNRHTMSNGTTILRRKMFQQVGGYWQHTISEDWDLFLRIAEVSRLANQRDCFLDYRLHTQSVNGRRIVEAQLYNEYAAALYLLRQAGKPEISFEEFLQNHRSQHWLQGPIFKLDALSIGQYREAVAEIYSGQPLRGYSRLGLAMLMSPARTARRVINIVSKNKDT